MVTGCHGNVFVNEPCQRGRDRVGSFLIVLCDLIVDQPPASFNEVLPQGKLPFTAFIEINAFAGCYQEFPGPGWEDAGDLPPQAYGKIEELFVWGSMVPEVIQDGSKSQDTFEIREFTLAASAG